MVCSEVVCVLSTFRQLFDLGVEGLSFFSFSL